MPVGDKGGGLSATGLIRGLAMGWGRAGACSPAPRGAATGGTAMVLLGCGVLVRDQGTPTALGNE